MANQQIQQNQQNLNSYEALDELGKKIVDLKLTGLRYEHIVGYLEKLGQKRENQTVREWFIEGGKYYEAYQFMKSKKKEEIEPDLEANDIADILKTSLDINDGNLDRLDPTVKTILEAKTYNGAISKEKAAELVWSCVGFGVDLPGILDSCLDQSENRYALMDFLSANRVMRDTGIYRNYRHYPTNPVYALMSKGAEALPTKMRDLFAAHSEEQAVINSFAAGILDHLFIEGYLRYFLGGAC